MSNYIEKIDQALCEIVPLKGTVVFPMIPISFEIPAGPLAQLCERASDKQECVFFTAQKDMAKDDPKLGDLYSVGTVSRIKQLLKLADGSVRVIVEGICRANIGETTHTDGVFHTNALCKTISIDDDGGIRGQALRQEVLDSFERFIGYLPKTAPELSITVKSLTNPGLLADFIASNVLIKYSDKQSILEEYDPLKRLELLAVVLEREMILVQTEAAIHRKVREQLDENQREYYMREQLKVLQNELGENDADNETYEYYHKIMSAHLPKEVEDRLLKEVKKLEKTPFAAAESGVMRNYIDTCLDIPWNKTTKDRLDVSAARRILDRDHDGLEKVKERILEYLAVKQLNPDVKNQILCLVGPPGVGKTSIGMSIASAMKRKYVRVSLGGVRDEADIRGHRKTYIGSMPGRIINALIQAGSRNPLILLDEIDKLTRDAHGDPSSALLEVLDSEQNKNFRDHFIELPVDLSDCLFIATANTLDTVPRPLIDRMEIIELKIYTRHEKLAIAQHHLIPKQMKRHGLNKRLLHIEDDAVYELIDYYTREAGVRNLERQIAALCRKAAMELLDHPEQKNVHITADKISSYLGCRKLLPEHIEEQDEIGEVNGLAFTELGGDLLRIEAAVMPGSGKLELTGSLGDVMKESAHLAISYIRAHAVELGVKNPDFYKNSDLHLHFPEGAIPKDGPSAGAAITTALVSLLSERPVRRDIAMTGEITLRGKVIAIGGLKEKTMAAYTAGATTVLIPEENVRDLEEIDPVVRESLTFIPCKTIDDVLRNALR